MYSNRVTINSAIIFKSHQANDIQYSALFIVLTPSNLATLDKQTRASWLDLKPVKKNTVQG